MKLPLIVIVGLPGAGKSFAGQILKKRFNAQVFETGDIIREEIERRGLKYTPETDKKMRHWFHPGRENLIVKTILLKLEKSKKKVKVVVGFRCYKEIKLLKSHYKGNVVVIAVVSSFKIRAKREMKRRRFGKSETLRYLKKRDKDEKRIGLQTLLKRADFIIDNSKLTKKQMETKLVKLVKRITKQI